MTAPTAADEAKYAAFMRAVLHFSNDRTAERLTAAAGALNGVEAYVVAMLAVMWDDMSATEAERDALRARAEAAEAALATARAETGRLRAAIRAAARALPEWSEGALEHLSPAELVADGVRMALREALASPVEGA
jgi:hypothetical protein